MTHSTAQDVIIVGAGIIGGAVALALARRGAQVTILERGGVGGGTSSAAAGMLAPQAEADHPSPLFDLGVRSRGLYREWVQTVIEESGVHIDFDASGLLYLAFDEEQAAVLKRRGDWQIGRGLSARWLSAAAARALEPDLGADLLGALFLPDEAWVDPSALTPALAVAARRRGAHIENHVDVRSLIQNGSRVTGVVAADGTRYRADWVVLAAGAWSTRITGLPFPDDWIGPCRGQIVVVHRGTLALRHLVYTHGAYIVPHPDELLLGTTVEHVGFDATPTDGGARSIFDGILHLVPGIEASKIERRVAGLRPEPRDGLPLIGPSAHLPGLALATGHFRNGILLAPLTGELLAEALTHGHTPEALAPFLPDRAALRWEAARNPAISRRESE